MIEKSITDLDVRNMDETNLKIDCKIAQLVITLSLNKLFMIIYPDNHSYIILVECFNSYCEMIFLLLLITRVNILHKE